MRDKPSFFAELKRRNVYKVAIAYAVVAWLLIQAGSILFPTFEAPGWVMKVFVTIVAAGFPIALVIAWAFEMTPEGMKRTENVSPNEYIPQWGRRKFATLILSVALVAGGLLVFQFWRTQNSPARADSGSKSIAVLPFESLSEDKANTYFADGIQDEILARLSKIADLKVISRTSTQKYRSKSENLRAIAQELGVTSILEGSVRKAGEDARITVQLINAVSDSHLWAETYERKVIDTFAVEGEVAQKIATSLEARLTGREKNDIAVAAGTRNAKAYDAYLHALAFVSRQGAEDKVIEFSRQAVALDPHYAEAWAVLAIAEAQKYFFPDHSTGQLARARTAAETALRLAPDLPDAHAAIGVFYYYCLQDYDRALGELEIARERAPNNSNVLLFIALVQRRQGKLDASIELQQQVATLDPLNEDVWVNLARSYRGYRRFEQARAMYDRALSIAPDEGEVIAQKAETYLAEGDLETAWRMIKDLKFQPTSRGFGAYINILFYQRRYDEAFALLSSALEKEQNLPAVFVAISHVALGNYHQVKDDPTKARSFYLQAEKELEQIRAAGDAGLLVADALLQVEARLGHRDEVEQLAKANLELIEKDKWQLPLEEESVARAYTILGDFERALPFLQHALTTPGGEVITPAYLRFDPEWDPVRHDPRFQQLANAKP